MWDQATLNDVGLPGVAVATTEFKTGADAQGRQIGFEPAMVYVPHPIQDRTDVEMKAIADDSVEAIVSALVVET